jgi:chloride channel 3/4/5
LKYQFKVEAEEHALAATSASEFASAPLGGHLSTPAPETLDDRLWRLILKVAGFVSRSIKTHRPVRLQERSRPGRSSEPEDILDGTEDDAFVELEEREDRPRGR